MYAGDGNQVVAVILVDQPARISVVDRIVPDVGVAILLLWIGEKGGFYELPDRPDPS